MSGEEEAVEVEVAVEVTTPDPTPDEPPADPAPTNAAVSGDVLALLVEQGERLTRLETAVGQLVDGVWRAQATAEEAQQTGEVALGAVDALAVETEEAVAALAEDTTDVTDELAEEIEEIAPQREHGWFAKRAGILPRRKDGAE